MASRRRHSPRPPHGRMKPQVELLLGALMLVLLVLVLWFGRRA